MDAFLTYNGITLSMIHTLTVDQKAVFDSSDTDQKFTRIILTVGSVLNAIAPPSLGAESPAIQMARVRHMLLQPRQALTFAPAGDGLFSVTPPDDENGPHPRECSITEITPGTWDIRYVIEFCLRDCDQGTSNRSWLSLKWSDTVSYDEHWFCTRRRQGVLVLSSRDPFTPDSYRGLVTPSVPAQFRRKSASYQLSENGLEVHFSFEDKQLREAPPTPATKIAGRQVLSVPLPGGLFKGEIQLRLSAPADVSKQDLVACAIRVAMARVNATGAVRATNGRMLIGGAIEENLDDEKCEVGLSLQWNIKPSSNGFSAAVAAVADAAKGRAKPINRLGTDFAWFGAPLAGNDPKRGIAPTTFGVSLVKTVASALNDPCSSVQEWPTINEIASSVLVEPTPGSGGTGIALSVTQATSSGSETGDNLTPNGSPGYEDSASLWIDDGPGVYDTYLITCHYTDEPGINVSPSTMTGAPAVPLRFHAGIRGLTVEFTATKVGDRPTIPFKNPSDPNVIWVGGTDSVDGIDLSPDGQNQRITVTGVYRYKFLDGTKVVESAPVPPFISRSLMADASTAIGQAATDIVFQTSGTNTFDDDNMSIVSLTGSSGTTSGTAGNQPVYA